MQTTLKAYQYRVSADHAGTMVTLKSEAEAAATIKRRWGRVVEFGTLTTGNGEQCHNQQQDLFETNKR